jgi:dTDP-4-dehydrorhamnose 3,5-epimerase
MLASVTQHVGVPEQLLIAKRQLSHAVRTAVTKAGGGAVEDLVAAIEQALAEIDIVEPHREELFVEAADRLPSPASDGQTGSCGLFDLLLLRIVGIEATVAAIDRVAWPELVHQQYLTKKRRKCRHLPKGETALRLIVILEQCSADRIGVSFLNALQQSRHRSGFGDRIGIEDQEDIAAGFTRSLIDGRAKAAVFRIGNQSYGMPSHELLDPLQGVVLRGIVDDDDVAILARQGLKARADGCSGVVSHDDGGATQHSLEEARIIIVVHCVRTNCSLVLEWEKNLQVSETSLPGVLIIKPRVFEDPRGFFMETYRQNALAEAGIAETFVQDNHSHSSRGVLRGLHYQLRNPQAKLCRVTQGEVLDIAVDIRAGSPNFGKWVSVVLSGENHAELYIPKGFAHGFVVRSETADFLYKCSDYFEAVDDRGVLWNDPQIGINWETPDPILSNKDKDYLPLAKIAQDQLPRYQP